MNKFWNFTEGESVRVLEINGEIAEESWFDDDITPKMFKDELFKGSGDIEVYINSNGGDCIAASQIYTMLTEYTGNVTIKIDGLAASAASVIAMAGNSVLMAPTAMMMIHNPSTVAFGDSEDMQKAIEMLDEVKESIINAYVIKTGMSRAKLSRLMDDETWMNAKAAIDMGFADGMIGGDIPAEAVSFSASAVTRSTNMVEKAITNKIKTQNDDAKIRDMKLALIEKTLDF